MAGALQSSVELLRRRRPAHRAGTRGSTSATGERVASLGGEGRKPVGEDPSELLYRARIGRGCSTSRGKLARATASSYDVRPPWMRSLSDISSVCIPNDRPVTIWLR